MIDIDAIFDQHFEPCAFTTTDPKGLRYLGRWNKADSMDLFLKDLREAVEHGLGSGKYDSVAEAENEIERLEKDNDEMEEEIASLEKKIEELETELGEIR